jgi:adenylate kinase family enzyme
MTGAGRSGFGGLEPAAVRGIRRARRVLVVGSGGAGKSTLAAELGEVLGLEVVHLDRAYWKPGWREPEREEWEGSVRRLLSKDSWVMDGNYGGTLDPRLAVADAVVFLDLPRTLCIRRVVARRLRYGRRARPDMAPGCPERLTLDFLKYLWRYPSERRPAILGKLARFSSSGGSALVLRSPAEVRRFVVTLEQHAELPDPAHPRPAENR